MPAMNAPLPPCVTIDASPDPVLQEIRDNNPAALENAGTQSAVANLLYCGGPLGSIVGHGAEGDIDTYKVTGECITPYNQDEWEPELAHLNGHVTSLILYGCCVGGGADGAALLQEIANTIQAPVSAPTGLLFLDGNGNFTLEAGAVWNTVQPAAAAAAAAAQPPAPPPGPAQPPSPSMPLPSTFVDTTYTPALGRDQNSTISGAIAAEVNWKTPYVPPGDPLAKTTGKLRVVLRQPGAPGLLTKTYLVLADRLLQDASQPEIYYQTSAKFRDLVASLKQK